MLNNKKTSAVLTVGSEIEANSETYKERNQILNILLLLIKIFCINTKSDSDAIFTGYAITTVSIMSGCRQFLYLYLIVLYKYNFRHNVCYIVVINILHISPLYKW